MSGTVNAAIPLQVQPPPQNMLGNAAVAAQQLMQFQQAQQEVGRQNALRNVLGRPGALDATGQPTPDTMSQVMSIDPNAGLKLRQNSMVMQEHQLRTDALRTDSFAKKMDLVHETYAPILETYEEALKTKSPQEAMADAQRALTEANTGLSQGGVFSPEEVHRFPTKFDPVQMRTAVSGVQQYNRWRDTNLQQEREKRQEEADKRRGWQVAVDPGNVDASGNPTQFRYNPGSGESTTLDGKPYKPVSIAKPEPVTPAGKVEHDAEVIANAAIRKKAAELGRPLTPEEEAAERQTARNAPKADLAASRGKDAALKADVRKDIDADPKFAQASDAEKGLEVLRRIRKAGQPQAGLEGDALDSAANWYRRTHELPPGFGGQADREAIMNRAAVMDREDGVTTTQRQQAWESAKPDLNSLKRTQLQRDAIAGFERGADREFDLAQSLIPKTPEPLNSQLLTRWVRAGEKQFGDVPNAQFYTALVSALDEYAKVIGGATGSAAASTDSARAQALSIIPPGATTAQIKGIIQTIKKGMDNRRAGYDDTISEIKGRLEGTVTPAMAPAAGGTPAPEPSGGARGDVAPLAAPTGVPASDWNKAIDRLKANPGAAAAFEEHFRLPAGSADKILKGGGAAPTAPSSPGQSAAPAAQQRAAAPVPLTAQMRPDDLVDGQVYQTARGAARWDKAQRKFFPVEGQ